MDALLVSLRPPDNRSSGSNSCICHLLVYAHTVNVSVAQARAHVIARRQTFPQGLAAISAGSRCTFETDLYRAMLWFGVRPADKLRTDVFGLVFFSSPYTPLKKKKKDLLPAHVHTHTLSSSSNLALIVSVIKPSCKDLSLNPLSSADYMEVRGLSQCSHTAKLPTWQRSSGLLTQIMHVRGDTSVCWANAKANCLHLMYSQLLHTLLDLLVFSVCENTL